MPIALTPGKLIFAVPSKLTPPIVRAVASFVAVAALPVIDIAYELVKLTHAVPFHFCQLLLAELQEIEFSCKLVALTVAGSRPFATSLILL